MHENVQNSRYTRSAFARVLLYLILLAFIITPARAAVIETWVHRYDNLVTNALDEPTHLAIDSAGHVVVVGTSREGFAGADILIIKYSGVDGSVIWQRRYDGAGNSDDFAERIDSCDDLSRVNCPRIIHIFAPIFLPFSGATTVSNRLGRRRAGRGASKVPI